MDDVTVFSRNPKAIFNMLINKYKYEFKAIGKPEYYNGADLSTDSTGYWTLSAKTCIRNVVETIESLMGITFKNYGAPMVTDYHPELNESDLLDTDYIKIYQMLISCAQWAVTIGRLDI